MHFETDHGVFLEAKVRNKIQSRGEEDGPDIKHAMDIPFVAVMSAEYIMKRLAVNEPDMLPNRMFHAKDGRPLRIGLEDMKFDREYKNYRMTISFTAFDTEKYAETFLCDSIKVTKLTPLEGHMIEVEFIVQLHPYKSEDIGNLHKKGIEFGIKQCFLQFEEQQKDLANAA